MRLKIRSELRGGLGALLLASPIFTLLAMTWPEGALAQSEEVRRIVGAVRSIEGQVARLEESRATVEPPRGPTHVEERLAEAEMFFRLRDYERASVLLLDLVEGHSDHRAHPNALFLLGESRFRDRDLFGARAHLREIIERAGEPGYGPYVQEALGMLIDVAVRTRSFDEVEGYFESLREVPGEEVAASTSYFRGKYLYHLGVRTRDGDGRRLEDGAEIVDPASLEEARQAFGAVAPDTPFHPQSLYFVGTIHTLRGEYEEAVRAFLPLARMEPRTRDHRQVVHLAYLALARLSMETGRVARAIRAYQAVPSAVPQMVPALYELAWAYTERDLPAQGLEALEVLAMVAPNSPRAADARILRGTILIEAERYADADAHFDRVREELEPTRLELEAFADEHPSLVEHFRGVVRDHIAELELRHIVPASAIGALRPGDDWHRADRLLEDLDELRRMHRAAEDLVIRLRTAIESPNPVTLFPDLAAQEEMVVALRNRIAQALNAVAELEAPRGARSPELERVRAERRELAEGIAELPADAASMATRDDALAGEWRRLEELARELRAGVFAMQSHLVAIEHGFSGAEAGQGTLPEGLVARLEARREEIEAHRRTIRQLERRGEAGRLRVGVGDPRYRRESQAVARLWELVTRERELSGAATGSSATVVVERLRELLALLAAKEQEVFGATSERLARVRAVVDREAEHVETYRRALDSLEENAVDVVGEIAAHTFHRARERFYRLVLRAEAGHVDVGWGRREAHRRDIDRLTRQRLREIEQIGEARRRILDLPPPTGAMP